MLIFHALTLVAAQTASEVTLPLDKFTLTTMEQGWGSPQAGKSVDGNPLKLGGTTFASGVGTHAESRFPLNLNGAALSFSATVGVDDEVGRQGSVIFKVIGDGNVLAQSPLLKGGQAPVELKADLRGVKRLILVVEDGDGSMNYDHADWANAKIVAIAGREKDIKTVVASVDPLIPIAAPNPSRTEIHGPRRIGGTPGREFIFRIPVSGKRPLKFTTSTLPAGLRLDTKHGVIRGTLENSGTTNVKLTVSGAGGTDERTIQIVGGGNKLALTPPMGWNSWNVWANAVDQQKVADAAKAIVDSGLADYGYAFVNIDDTWEAGRNAAGEIQTNEKFPDMGGLADQVHGLGLKLGIYSSPGPKTCAGFEGSWGHEKQDANSYAKWGIDYLKHDWCAYGQIYSGNDVTELKRPYLVMRESLDQSGRDIVYSLCQYGMGDVYKWGNMVGADLWRTTGDITDTWSSMSNIGFSHSERSPYAGPSGWNDPDMLVVGWVGWGPNIRPTQLKPNEQVTHITLWSMLAAPLIIGCDLTRLDGLTKALLMNHDVVEIDQDPLGRAATRKWKKGDLEVWSRPLWDGSVAVALFNRGMERSKIGVDWKTVGLTGAQPVRDCWQRKDLGVKTGYSATVPAHGAILIRVGKITK